jgi:hypothetical protein
MDTYKPRHARPAPDADELALALARMDDDGYGCAITTTPPGPFAVRVRREVARAAARLSAQEAGS